MRKLNSRFSNESNHHRFPHPILKARAERAESLAAKGEAHEADAAFILLPRLVRTQDDERGASTLAESILRGHFGPGDTVAADAREGQLVFEKTVR